MKQHTDPSNAEERGASGSKKQHSDMLLLLISSKNDTTIDDEQTVLQTVSCSKAKVQASERAIRERALPTLERSRRFRR
jgi:hypothetical protein